MTIYGFIAEWGCEWFKDWRTNVELAVSRGQRLVVVYFSGDLGKGKVKWEDLPAAGLLNKAKGGLWDGVGLGGSQKGEVAFLDMKGFGYEEIEFDTFMNHYLEYEPPVEVE
jgi:hypothetical protein